jgi:hypothetical protein
MNQRDFTLSKNFNPGIYGVKAIVLFLREMFRVNSDFGFTVYDDDLNKEEAFSSLLITTKHDWETTYRGKRPAIFVSRGNLINGVNGTQGQGRVFSIENNGQTTSYSDLLSFPIMVECLSEKDIESETLASMVALFISADLRPLRSLGLQINGQVTQTPAQIYETQNISFISSVIMQVAMQRNIKAIKTVDNMLEKIQFRINESLNINIKED